MKNPVRTLAVALFAIAIVALAGCSGGDEGRIAALEERLSRAEVQEQEGREAAAAERAEIAGRLADLDETLKRLEAESDANEDLNAETRSLVTSLLNALSGDSNSVGMRPTDEQIMQDVGMERERLLQIEPRFEVEGASLEQRTVVEAGIDCLALRDQGMPEQMQELILENYRLNAERTENDAELVMMTYMACGTAGVGPRDIGTPSAERAAAVATLVACYEEHEAIVGERPSLEMVDQSLSIFEDDGTATAIVRLICQDLSREAMRQ